MSYYIELERKYSTFDFGSRAEKIVSQKTLALVASFNASSSAPEKTELSYFEPWQERTEDGPKRREIRMINLAVDYEDLKKQLIVGASTGQPPLFQI